MTAPKAIFLSASVPTLDRVGRDDFDAYLIKEAVTALIEVVLGRHHLVWGGQPAITPIVAAAAKGYDVPFAQSVTLYQSKAFKAIYPQENAQFDYVVQTDGEPNYKAGSLSRMRQQMLTAHEFHAAVFIGGMDGVVAEYELFKDLHPSAIVLPVPTPGGTSRALFAREPGLPRAFETAVDFTYWFQKLLKVDISRPRAGSLADG